MMSRSSKRAEKQKRRRERKLFERRDRLIRVRERQALIKCVVDDLTPKPKMTAFDPETDLYSQMARHMNVSRQVAKMINFGMNHAMVYGGSVTGRFSSSMPNLSNVPRPLLKADLAELEVRTLAQYALADAEMTHKVAADQLDTASCRVSQKCVKELLADLSSSESSARPEGSAG